MAITILVVDDEQDFLDSLTRGLRLEGYADVTAVTRSTDVPALFDEKRFACAVLDITMPELDGSALLRIIKERSPRTECNSLTGEKALDNADVAAQISLARPVRYEPISEHDAEGMLRQAGMPPDRIARLLRFYCVVRDGPAAVRSTHIRDVLGRPPTPFASFVRHHGEAWS
jgi:CheY-like chemotaxis protein